MMRRKKNQNAGQPVSNSSNCRPPLSVSEEAAENFFYAFPESGDFYHAILQEFDDIISGHSGNYQITVIPLSGLRLPPMIMRNPEKKYAPCFDERIFTEKLIGKPSLGPSPPRFIY